MTLEYLMQAIGEIAVHNNLVNYYLAGGSVYEVNAEDVKEYPLVFLSPTGEHTVRESTTRYTLTIFYMDRLWDDSSNDTQVTSNAIEALKNLYRQIPQIQWVTDVQEEPRLRIFAETEKMADRVAGAYMTLWCDVLNPSVCPEYFDEFGYPLGNWLPPVVTTNVLDNLASKAWVYDVIGQLNDIDPDDIEALVTALDNYTLTKDFATINGQKITEGGDIVLPTQEEMVEAIATALQPYATKDITNAITLLVNQYYTELDGRVDVLERDSATKSELGAVEDRVQDLEDGMSNYATKQDAQHLQDQIDAIDLSPYATETELEGVEQRVQDLEDGMSNYATKQDAQDLQDGIDALGLSKQDVLTQSWGILIQSNAIRETVPVFNISAGWSELAEIKRYVLETQNAGNAVIVYQGYCIALMPAGQNGSWYGGGFKADYMNWPSVKYCQMYYEGLDDTINFTEETIDFRDYVTQTDLQQYQQVLTAGTGIDITNNVISVDAPVVQSQQITNIWSGTQQQYDALGTYHNDWLYFIDRV